jgi:hypothetical protein
MTALEPQEPFLIRPGDRLLFTTPNNVSREQVEAFREYFHELWPDVAFQIVTGMTLAGVVRNEAAS